MRTHTVLLAMLACVGASIAAADNQFPDNASFTTLAITSYAIEGLTGDEQGNLYTTGRAPLTDARCPLWQIDPDGDILQVGSIGNTAPGCSPSGLTRDDRGSFYIADGNQGGVIWRLTAADRNPLAPWVTDVPGTNGVAFDRHGNLWTGDGTTGRGRVWRITPDGVAAEMFRIQPMRNSMALGGNVAGEGVGRQVRTYPPGSTTITVPESPTPSVITPAGGQDLVANGLAFTHNGDLIVADTARGALWKIQFDAKGNVASRMDCDATFAPKTLCLDNILVAHALLEGTDGIALDRAGNIWNAANERNAIVVVASDRRVMEIFRNPLNAADFRNSADPAVGNDHILEFPTSPVLSGHRFCVANSDGNRRDNSPNSAGEINSSGPVGARGKISCMDQPVNVPG